MVKLGPACSSFPHTVASESSADTPHPIASTLVADANTSGPPVTSVLVADSGDLVGKNLATLDHVLGSLCNNPPFTSDSLADSPSVASTSVADAGYLPGNPAAPDYTLESVCKDPAAPIYPLPALPRGAPEGPIPNPSIDIPEETSCHPEVPVHHIFHMEDNPLPFTNEFDAFPFKKHTPPPISLVSAAAFKKLMDSGEEVFTFQYRTHTSKPTTADLCAVGNDPAPTTALHSEPLPTDEAKLIAKVVPSEYHDFFGVFSCEEAKLMPPHRPYDHTIDLENDQMPLHSHIYPLSGTELSTLREFLDYMLRKGFIWASNSLEGPQFSLRKRRMVHFDFVWTFA